MLTKSLVLNFKEDFGYSCLKVNSGFIIITTTLRKKKKIHKNIDDFKFEFRIRRKKMCRLCKKIFEIYQKILDSKECE